MLIGPNAFKTFLICYILSKDLTLTVEKSNVCDSRLTFFVYHYLVHCVARQLLVLVSRLNAKILLIF